FLWLKWAQLNVAGSKIHRNVELLRESLKKFEKADACESKQPSVLCYWGHALMHHGVLTENIEQIREAQQKVMKSLAIDSKSADAWYYYGSCLVEFGRYFGEEEYFLNAIEKFQNGLLLHKNEPLLLYGMALCHYAIGDMNSDVKW